MNLIKLEILVLETPDVCDAVEEAVLDSAAQNPEGKLIFRRGGGRLAFRYSTC